MQGAGISDVAHSIQLAVAPVFLLSGVGVFLTVLTNRLSRIFDRARSLEPQLTANPETGDTKHVELQILSRRAQLISQSITLCTLCALLISLVIVALFVAAAMGRSLSTLIVILFIAALLAFIGGMVAFLLEIRAATHSLRFGPIGHGMDRRPPA